MELHIYNNGYDKKNTEKDGKKKPHGIVTSHYMQRKQEYSDKTIQVSLSTPGFSA